MATPDELRTAIDSAREEFRAALKNAGPAWEKAPAGGEGEDAWSPRQVAEHAIPAEVWFASKVCESCGYPGVRWEGETAFATAESAADAFEQAVAISSGRLKYVTETDLPKSVEGARLNTQGWLEMAAGHLRDHAQQIAAAGS